MEGCEMAPEQVVMVTVPAECMATGMHTSVHDGVCESRASACTFMMASSQSGGTPIGWFIAFGS